MPQAAENQEDGRYISVLEANRYMLEEQVACDVTFTVMTSAGVAELVHAHRYMLIARNPVFGAMLCGSMAETRGHITIRDVDARVLRKIIRFSPDILKVLLHHKGGDRIYEMNLGGNLTPTHLSRYLYCESIDITSDDVFDILYASRKYLVDPVTQQCFRFLNSYVTVDTVCPILKCAVFYEEETLMRKCLRTVAIKTRDVLRTGSFLDLSKEAMQKIVESRILNVSEDELFESCIRWCRAECDRNDEVYRPTTLQKHLGESFFHFRIRNISTKLTHQCMIASGEPNQDMVFIQPELVQKFIHENREFVKPGADRCDFISKPSGFVNTFSDSLMHDFTISDEIILHGFEVVDSPRSCITGVKITVLQDSVKLFHTSLNITAGRHETVYGRSIPLYLPKQIPLHAGNFSIELTLRSPGGSSTIGCCKPSSEGVEINGVRFKAIYKMEAFLIGTLLFSVI